MERKCPPLGHRFCRDQNILSLERSESCLVPGAPSKPWITLVARRSELGSRCLLQGPASVEQLANIASGRAQ